jgi:hypothetical protein
MIVNLLTFLFYLYSVQFSIKNVAFLYTNMCIWNFTLQQYNIAINFGVHYNIKFQ